MVRTEVCVQSTAGARTAAAEGADRVELCAALVLDGLTPSAGLIEEVGAVLPIHVLVRPRAGNFCYEDDEIALMIRDIRFAIDLGAASVVVGALTADGDIDVDAMVRLLAAAGDVPVTFHRAFDRVREPLASLDVLLELGVARLLTSGGRPTAFEGRSAIAELVDRAGSDLVVMPGGGITAANVSELIGTTGVAEIHFSARSPVPVPSNALQECGPQDCGPQEFGLQEYELAEFRTERFETDPDKVRAVLAAAARPSER